MHSEAEFLFWDKNCPFMTNNKNLSKRLKNQNHTYSFIPLGSINMQFSTNTEKEQVII